MTPSNIIYRIAYRTDPASLQESLGTAAVGFVELEPILPVDKVTRKLMEGKNFSEGLRGSSTGEITAHLNYLKAEFIPKNSEKFS